MTHYIKGKYYADHIKISRPLTSSNKLPDCIDFTAMTSSETDRVYFRQNFENWSYEKQIKFVQKNTKSDSDFIEINTDYDESDTENETY